MSRLIAVVLLLLLNGFFVAVEFALVRSRRTRLEAMARGGDAQARLVLRALSNLSRVLSASQLGITLASLGLGWVAEAALGETLEHWFAGLPLPFEVAVRTTIGAVVALASVTYVHVVFGELAPRALALQHPEKLARWLAPPLLLFAWLVSPFIWAMDRSSQLVLRALGQKATGIEESVHSPEELRMIVEQSQESGLLEAQDAEMIDAVFEFSEKNAREVMTPRTGIVALPVDASLQETLALMEESGFSRYPVYDETIDDIVGVVHAKDLLAVLRHAPATFSLSSVLRRVHQVPGSREVEEVLADFKRLKVHMAVVLDEYGGTAGIVTMEDLLEELVGEILDEFDEPMPAVSAEGGEKELPGATHIADVNERFGLAVPADDYTTIGGYVFGSLGRLPVVGDRVTFEGTTFVVTRMEGRRVDSLLVETAGS